MRARAGWGVALWLVVQPALVSAQHAYSHRTAYHDPIDSDALVSTVLILLALVVGVVVLMFRVPRPRLAKDDPRWAYTQSASLVRLDLAIDAGARETVRAALVERTNVEGAEARARLAQRLVAALSGVEPAWRSCGSSIETVERTQGCAKRAWQLRAEAKGDYSLGRGAGYRSDGTTPSFALLTVLVIARGTLPTITADRRAILRWLQALEALGREDLSELELVWTPEEGALDAAQLDGLRPGLAPIAS
jgi:hypothetical protein